MKNKLDKRIDEALDESSCLEEEWWMKYAKFPTEESDGQSIPLCLVPDFIAEAERRERERIDQKVRTDISAALAKAEAPMGVSQWEAYGRKYGYWEYFKAKTEDFDPKHPRCLKCGKLMAFMEPHIWMCECSPYLRLSIG